ncbi:SRPBCC family protein [Sabulicella rubraurantiaca]|uniref:SRPBCC family protein n=1 Tax=Sabulicella rubraurantiaca TaxID=2811429 RepID=UPI001A96C88F|nr:SRPBCC family protein [Sabulicella rubraurantiaca]
MADRLGNGRTRERMEHYRAPSGSREHAGPGFGGAGWALAGAAGVAALAILGTQLLGQPNRGRARETEAANGWSEEPEVEYSITIERPADELYRAWRDPATLPRIMAFLADIRPSGDGRSEWRVDGPLGQSHAWVMQITEERPGELIRASSGGGALVTECEVRFRAATGGRGTIATLRVRFDPPGGMLGDVAARFFNGVVPKELASKALRYFKSLVLTGEIPTTDRQPAARRDSR